MFVLLNKSIDNREFYLRLLLLLWPYGNVILKHIQLFEYHIEAVFFLIDCIKLNSLMNSLMKIEDFQMQNFNSWFQWHSNNPTANNVSLDKLIDTITQISTKFFLFFFRFFAHYTMEETFSPFSTITVRHAYILNLIIRISFLYKSHYTLSKCLSSFLFCFIIFFSQWTTK